MILYRFSKRTPSPPRQNNNMDPSSISESMNYSKEEIVEEVRQNLAEAFQSYAIKGSLLEAAKNNTDSYKWKHDDYMYRSRARPKIVE